MNSSTALRARPKVVSRAVLKQSPILLALLGPPFIACLILAEWRLAGSMVGQVIVLAGFSLALRRSPFPDDLRKIEALITLASLFLIGTILVTPAFVVLGMPVIDALFEAVSGITSTGLSLASEAETWPIPGHLLRGWVQWCGGFAIAFAGLALLSGSSGASLSMGSSSFARRDNLTSLKMQARQVLVVYIVLTVLAMVACLLVLPNWWEAISIALAAVSTGGFSPRDNSLADYSALAQGVVILICIAAALSLMFYVQIFRNGLRQALGKSAVRATLGMMAIGTAICITINLILTKHDASALYHGALNFLSGFTTAGFSVSVVSSHPALVPLFIVAMMIGGDTGSTGGGIKVSRVVLLARTCRLSILRSRVPPSAVTYLREGDTKVTFDRLVAVTSLLALYLVTLMACWFIFLVSGTPALPSLFEVTSALSTVGLSEGVTEPSMAAHLKITLMIAMLLGRLEFIALIVLCLPGTWWKGV